MGEYGQKQEHWHHSSRSNRQACPRGISYMFRSNRCSDVTSNVARHCYPRSCVAQELVWHNALVALARMARCYQRAS